MKKLIELDAAIKATWKDTGYTDPLNVMTAIRDRIEALPTVDAVPVVRCKDCKYSDGGTDEDGKLFFKCLGWVYGGTREDDFCSHGKRNERMDGDEHG